MYLLATFTVCTITSKPVDMAQDVLVSKNGRQCVDFGRFHDTLPINDCPPPVKSTGELSGALGT